MSLTEYMWEELHKLKNYLHELFRDNNVYVGFIDISRYVGDDDTLREEDIDSKLRVCFSNHDNVTIIHWELLKKIEEVLGDNYIMYFTQNGTKGASAHPLYLYLHIEAKEEYLKSLLFKLLIDE